MCEVLSRGRLWHFDGSSCRQHHDGHPGRPILSTPGLQATVSHGGFLHGSISACQGTWISSLSKSTWPYENVILSPILVKLSAQL